MKREPAPPSTSPYGDYETMLKTLTDQLARGTVPARRALHRGRRPLGHGAALDDDVQARPRDAGDRGLHRARDRAPGVGRARRRSMPARRGAVLLSARAAVTASIIAKPAPQPRRSIKASAAAGALSFAPLMKKTKMSRGSVLAPSVRGRRTADRPGAPPPPLRARRTRRAPRRIAGRARARRTSAARRRSRRSGRRTTGSRPSR